MELKLVNFMIRLRSAEAEELRAVRGRKGHRLVGAVIGDAGGIRDPAWRRGQRGGLFQRETGRVNRWPGNHYPALRDAGATDRKRGKSQQVGTGDVWGHLPSRRYETAPRIQVAARHRQRT